MNKHIPGAQLAAQLFSQPNGATMAEIIAATGGPQYNVLKRLEARGYRLRKIREGKETRYYADPPPKPFYEATVTSKGQVTLPKEVRERLRIGEGDKVRFTVEIRNPGLCWRGPSNSIRDLFGILGKPRRTSPLSTIWMKPFVSTLSSDICGQKDDRTRHERSWHVSSSTDDIAQARQARRSLWPRDARVRLRALSIASLCASLSGCWQAFMTIDAVRSRTIIEKLLSSSDLMLEDEGAVRAALQAFRTGNVDFADALIGEVNRLRGCDATATFDRKAARLDTFIRVS